MRRFAGTAHICAGTRSHLRRDSPTSAPGLARISAETRPHLRRDSRASVQLLALSDPAQMAEAFRKVGSADNARRATLGNTTTESPATEKGHGSVWRATCGVHLAARAKPHSNRSRA